MARRVSLLLALALCTPAWADTQTRAPTSDTTETSTWGGDCASTTRWQCVDDYPDTGPTDSNVCVSNGGARLIHGFTAFSITSSAVASVQVDYYDADTPSSGTNFAQSCLRVGGSDFCASTHNPAGTTLEQHTDTWATNPCTTSTWTEAEVEGTAGSCNLEGFGYGGTDCAPDILFSSAQLVVTFTAAASGARNRLLN